MAGRWPAVSLDKQNDSMGITYVEGTLTGPTGQQETLQFLVDSGATYTLVPRATWRSLGLTSKRTVSFRMADGSRMDREVGECHIRLTQGDAHTPVILGEEGDLPLLGTVTLEELGLVLNPFTRTLHPMNMLLV